MAEISIKKALAQIGHALMISGYDLDCLMLHGDLDPAQVAGKTGKDLTVDMNEHGRI